MKNKKKQVRATTNLFLQDVVNVMYDKKQISIEVRNQNLEDLK
jgi:hypothetical protein